MTEEAWGPTMSGGRRRRRPLRWLLWTVVVAVALAALGGVGVALYASAQIERIDVDGLDPSLSGPLNVLVIGNDSREGLTEEQQRELTTGSTDGQRTDTIFILSVSGSRVALLAFPRDLWVERCDGSAGRINAALALGGPECLVRTVASTSGIPIDDYVEVDFLGFRDIVDAVGGVEVCVERPIEDPFAGIDLDAGCQILDGRTALGYVRVRKIDSDLHRIERQQQFLAALARRLVQPGTVANPVRLVRTAGAVGRALTADAGLGPIDLARLAWGARGLSAGSAVTETVPTVPETRGGAAVLLPVEDEAEALFAAFRDGSIHDRAVAGLAPQDVRVRVLNGAGVSGLAGRVSDALAADGFDVVGVGNAERSERTTVLHPPGQAAAGALVAGSLPASPAVVEDASVDVVTVVLGGDQAG